MFEKLLELLLSAKSGAVATIFLIGTTGALVTATVQNGVTTITVTPNVSASPSASASASPSASTSASPSASASASPSASSSPSSSSSPSANCSDAAHTMAAALQEVNGAYAQYHSALERDRERAKSGALRTDLVNADNLLKQIRAAANQKIHSLFTCVGGSDEDSKDSDSEDNDEDHATSSASPSASPSATPTATPTASPTATPTASASPSASPSASASPLVTGNDAKSVADSAVAAMKLVFDTVSAELQSASPAPTHRPEGTFSGFGRGNGHGDHD